MVIVVSTIASKTMFWRCDERFTKNLDKVTISLAKGAAMGLATYLTIKLIGVAHDNEWSYLATGWGAWFMFEIGIGVVLPLALFSTAIRNNMMKLIRFSALLTVFGVVLNRVNTAIIAFNWKLPHREIPQWREVIISLTIFCIYITVYRFILYRLPILYQWKSVEEPATVMVPSAVAEPAYSGGTLGAEAMPLATYRTSEAEEY
jgi:Ni/Fe-hydrogenase subunit HybB-like protein